MKNSEEIVGKWVAQHFWTGKIYFTFEFRKDGTYSYISPQVRTDATYTIRDGVIEYANGSKAKVRIEKNTLWYTRNGTTMPLTRV